VEHDGKVYRWGLAKTRKGAQKLFSSDLSQIKEIVRDIRTVRESESRVRLPVAIWYGVNRAVLDVPLKPRWRTQFDIFAAHERALAGGRNDFKDLFKWFREREDVENEQRVTDSAYRDSQLTAVRTAVSRMVEGFEDLRVRRRPPRMVVRKGKHEFVINQLSDGEKCVLAMVGDLARRLAIANPGLEDPLDGQGVVLIDEIDLHLHPKWQRDVVNGLRRTFPNCQFVLTTHSPQVLSEVRREETYLLRVTDDGICAFRPSSSSYGRETNQILDEIMDVPPRPPEFEDKIRQYFRLLAAEDLRRAESLRQELEREIGKDEPEFARADAFLRRKEILGR
jgi:predicted ATP-binding protein involved in virulence